MTNVQLALLCGAALGAGIFLILWQFLPANVDLSDARYRLSSEYAEENAAYASLLDNAASRSDKIGIWATRHLPRWAWGAADKDLSLLRISPYQHLGAKVAGSALMLILVPVLGYLATVQGMSVAIPTITSVALAVGFWFSVDRRVRTKARLARHDFTHSIAAYLDLVALERAAGSGAWQSLSNAAEIGNSWVFQRIRQELRRAELSGAQPWDALGIVATQLEIPALHTLANTMRGTDEGAQVYAQLRAQADQIDHAIVKEATTKARDATTKMSVPITLTIGVLTAFLLTPMLMGMSIGITP